MSTHVAFPELAMATAAHTGVPLSVKVTVPGLTMPVRAAVNVTCDPDVAGLALEVRVMEGVTLPASVCEKAAAAFGAYVGSPEYEALTVIMTPVPLVGGVRTHVAAEVVGPVAMRPAAPHPAARVPALVVKAIVPVGALDRDPVTVAVRVTATP
jgi:hypothetical protein